jgi:hypothetical protein
MKTKPTKKELTFGDLIANFYNAYGKRRAEGFLRLLIKAHLVEFRGRTRYVFSRGNRKA